MAKLTMREVWMIAKDQPIYRFGAFAIAVSFLIYAGVQLSPFWGIWRLADNRPRPAVKGIYKIGSDCFDFANLPRGWRPARQSLDGKEIRIENGGHGFRLFATLVSRNAETPLSKINPPVRSDYDSGLAGYAVWIDSYGDRELRSDGSRHKGRYVICQTVENSGWRPDEHMCFAEDEGRPGKYSVQIWFARNDGKYADPLLDEAYAALSTGLRSCVTSPS